MSNLQFLQSISRNVLNGVKPIFIGLMMIGAVSFGQMNQFFQQLATIIGLGIFKRLEKNI